MKSFFPALMLLALASCVPPQERGATTTTTPTTVAQAPAAPAAGGEQEMVCTRERPTGSSISKRVCRPKNDAEANSGQRAVERAQRNSLRMTGPGAR